MLISLTVGKVDAGVAVLLTQDKRLVSYSFNTDSIDCNKYTNLVIAHVISLKPP